MLDKNECTVQCTGRKVKPETDLGTVQQHSTLCVLSLGCIPRGFNSMLCTTDPH